jgi:hypothetical protein
MNFEILATQEHGGDVAVESEAGKRSCFSFTLPLCAEHDQFSQYVNSTLVETKTKEGQQ